MTDVPELLLAHRAWLRRLAGDLVRAERADDVVQETLRIAIERPRRRTRGRLGRRDEDPMALAPRAVPVQRPTCGIARARERTRTRGGRADVE
jgi:hypothetical protein